jgi:hypothetical protein
MPMAESIRKKLKRFGIITSNLRKLKYKLCGLYNNKKKKLHVLPKILHFHETTPCVIIILTIIDILKETNQN